MKVVQISFLADNYGYLIVCEKSREAAIIDPSEAEPAWRAVEREAVNLRAILNTHHHRDHTGGNAGLLERYSLDVYAHRIDRDRLPGLTHPVEDGSEVTVGELRARVLFIPGHTKGHVAYLFENRLFCGDTLFIAGCGRLFEGTAEQMLSSLTRLRDLPGDTLVYCGHEYTEKNLQFAMTLEPNNRTLVEKIPQVHSLRIEGKSTVPSTISEEKDTNPFFRWESKEIQQNLKKSFPSLGSDPVSVFSQIRKLKDQF
ncbi:MAG: hydroxyacylglutathione hydrolase [Deltaproteobacteria bacterium]|nr:hydroxyacylglutathione hydrolase [Deltaproteobacteria bacterium]